MSPDDSAANDRSSTPNETAPDAERKQPAAAKERTHPRDPLHGITLEAIVKQLVYIHGWAEMGRRIPIRCFQVDPSMKSSLKFLRKTPWARQKVEAWYIAEHLKR